MKIDYKEGDLVYCHKDSICLDKVIHKKGNFYRIYKISKYLNLNYNYLFLIEIENTSEPKFYNISYNYPISETHSRFFNDFFMSKKEYRKLKLKKLNERV